jgi:hypothetical protein
MNELKTAAGSWGRAFLVAMLSLYAAGVTDPKALIAAGLSSCIPPIIRWLSPTDKAMGIGKDER